MLRDNVKLLETLQALPTPDKKFLITWLMEQVEKEQCVSRGAQPGFKAVIDQLDPMNHRGVMADLRRKYKRP